MVFRGFSFLGQKERVRRAFSKKYSVEEIKVGKEKIREV